MWKLKTIQRNTNKIYFVGEWQARTIGRIVEYSNFPEGQFGKCVVEKIKPGVPGWLSWLSVRLLISAQVVTSRFGSSTPASGSVLAAWSLFGILSPSLCLSPARVHSLSK